MALQRETQVILVPGMDDPPALDFAGRTRRSDRAAR
jgi:hypothetical protein